MLFCFILRVYWLSLSFNSSRCLLLSRRINWWTEWREKSSRQSRELEVFSFISRLTVKIPKALRDWNPSYSISTCIHITRVSTEQWRDNVHQTMLFEFYCTPFFVCYVSAHDMLKWIKFKMLRKMSALEFDTPSLLELFRLVALLEKILWNFVLWNSVEIFQAKTVNFCNLSPSPIELRNS